MNLLQLGVYMASSGPTATGLREGCHCTQLLFAVVLLTAAVTQNIPPPPQCFAAHADDQCDVPYRRVL